MKNNFGSSLQQNQKILAGFSENQQYQAKIFQARVTLEEEIKFRR